MKLSILVAVVAVVAAGCAAPGNRLVLDTPPMVFTPMVVPQVAPPRQPVTTFCTPVGQGQVVCQSS